MYSCVIAVIRCLVAPRGYRYSHLCYSRGSDTAVRFLGETIYCALEQRTAPARLLSLGAKRCCAPPDLLCPSRSVVTMRSPRREQALRNAESLHERYCKTIFCLVSMTLVTIALSALPIVMKEMGATAVPLRKVLSYESNIVLMESSIGLGDSFSKLFSWSKRSKLRHVIILAQNGALSRGRSCRCAPSHRTCALSQLSC